MSTSKVPFLNLEPEYKYCDVELIKHINSFIYQEDGKKGIFPFMNILSLGRIHNNPIQTFIDFPRYEDPYNELPSHSSSSNRSIINFIHIFREHMIYEPPSNTPYEQFSHELSVVCDKALEILTTAEQASRNLDNIIDNHKEQRLRKRSKESTTQQCLEEIIDNPYSSSLWEISKLLQKLDPKGFGNFHRYIEYIGFKDSSDTYHFTTGDKEQDLDNSEFFRRVAKRYEGYMMEKPLSLFDTIIEASEVVMENIEYEFQARTQKIEEEMDELELQINNSDIKVELFERSQRLQSDPIYKYNQRRKD